MNEYEACKTDLGMIAMADIVDTVDGMSLAGVLEEWGDYVGLGIDDYARDCGLSSTWVEGHPLNIIMLDKVSELMGLELRENSLASVNNAYDWLASVVGGGK